MVAATSLYPVCSTFMLAGINPAIAVASTMAAVDFGREGSLLPILRGCELPQRTKALKPGMLNLGVGCLRVSARLARRPSSSILSKHIL